MSHLFTIDWPIIILLGIVAIVASVQTLRYARAHRALLAALQIPCALLLAVALLLRDEVSGGTLVVLTAGADLQLQTVPTDRYIALPGAPTSQSDQSPRVELAPDLATALRQHPEIRHVHVIGDGLEIHDREALGARDFSFTPNPTLADAAPAIVALEPPPHVSAGQWWQVSGRVSGAELNVELLDPAGVSVASTPVDKNGQFRLQTIARASGPVIYTLRLIDAEGVEVPGTSSMPLPINARAGAPMRALLLAAVPSPELKYLRRWAADAGVELDSRIGLAPGLMQGKAGFSFDSAMLNQLDLLIVDERSWPLLARHRDALHTAVRNGLGLLIRITGPVPKGVREDWRALGVELAVSAKQPSEVSLTDMPSNGPADVLHAWPFALAANATDNISTDDDHADHGSSVILLSGLDGQAVATQQLLSQGRIGVTGLLDSFRLYTRGERERHATLWSTVFQQLARARGEPDVVLPTQAIIGQRAVLCGLDSATKLIAADHTHIPLVLDSHANNCAAFWPRAAGWYRLTNDAKEAGAKASSSASESEPATSALTPQKTTAFYAFDPTTIAGLLNEQRGAATAALVNHTAPAPNAGVDSEAWRRAALLMWLTLMTASGWLERRATRAGNAHAATPNR